MRRPVLLLLLVAACGDPAGPGSVDAAVTAVNGAALPLIAPGDTLALEGRGLGPAQGGGTITLGGASLEVVTWGPTGIVAVAPASIAGDIVVTTDDGLVTPPLVVRARPSDQTPTDQRPWSAGQAMPLPLAQTAAAGIAFPSGDGYTGLVVLSGGLRADGSLTDSTRLGITGGTATVTAWASAPDTIVPIARRLHAMVGASALTSRIVEGGVAWMIGGIDATGRALADVFGISVGADGSYGLWTPLTPLPGERGGAAATVGLGAIYVVGGFDAAGISRPDVVMATINAEGTINGWFHGPDLPAGLSFAAATVAGDRLYVTGGQTGVADPDSTDRTALSNAVYSLRLSRRTGFFADTVWTTEVVTLTTARARHALYAAAGGLVVVGGVLADSAGADTESAARAAGVLGPFTARTAASRPGSPTRDFGAPVLLDAAGLPVVTVLGGVDSGGPSAAIWWH